MSSGERPIGAAKHKQSNTEALCQPRPPLPRYQAWLAEGVKPIRKYSQAFRGGVT